jgi:hypothetical protein
MASVKPCATPPAKTLLVLSRRRPRNNPAKKDATPNGHENYWIGDGSLSMQRRLVTGGVLPSTNGEYTPSRKGHCHELLYLPGIWAEVGSVDNFDIR